MDVQLSKVVQRLRKTHGMIIMMSDDKQIKYHRKTRKVEGERYKVTDVNEKKFQVERIKICFSTQTFFGYPTITSKTTVTGISGHRNIYSPTCKTGVYDLI